MPRIEEFVKGFIHMKALVKRWSLMFLQRKNPFSLYNRSLKSLPKHVARTIACSFFHVGKFKPYGLNFIYTMEYMLGRRHFLRCIGRSTKTMMASSR